MTTISNWGNYPAIDAELSEFNTAEQATDLLKNHKTFAVRGSGLSYGDASLAETILSVSKFNKVLTFDDTNGLITAESGVTLDSILKIIVPKGWFLPVTPGTKFITVGGAVAGDVHGKNHHCEGSFCKYVVGMTVMLATGEITLCSPMENAELFNTVCGGLGLSAVILTVQFRLKPIQSSYIRQRNIIAENLDQLLNQLQQFNDATYSVAWIDCLARGKRLGRGVLMLGEHAQANEMNERVLKVHKEPTFNIPFSLPSFTLNPSSIRLFNTMYFHKHAIGKRDLLVHYDTFFYPLDFVKNWNRMYGKRGFLQYQFVLPFNTAVTGLRTILESISQSGMASFLAVLKVLGPGEFPISFPMPGFTLALDFPVNKRIFSFLDELDKQVVELGGRIYLVKDARMSAETYRKGYPNAARFRDMVKFYDPSGKFSTSLSKRLQII